MTQRTPPRADGNSSLGLDELAALLDVQRPASRAGLRTALDPRHKLAEVLVSVARAEGAPVGALGAAILESQHARSTAYAEALDRLPGPALPLKGPAISRMYPAGIVRGCVDLDVLCESEEHFWDCVAAIAPHAVAPPELASWDGSNGKEFVAAFTLGPGQSAFEAAYRVELTTCALPGDFESVPSRSLSSATLAAHPAAANLALLGEEQFQRPVAGRDVVDALVLVQHARLHGEPVVDVVSDAGLAPQVAELLGHSLVRERAPWTAAWCEELNRTPRRTDHRSPRAARPVQGIHLSSVRSGSARTSSVLTLPSGDVLATPIGTFALTADPAIDIAWLDSLAHQIESTLEEEVVPGLVELEVAVPRSTPALR